MLLKHLKEYMQTELLERLACHLGRVKSESGFGSVSILIQDGRISMISSTVTEKIRSKEPLGTPAKN